MEVRAFERFRVAVLDSKGSIIIDLNKTAEVSKESTRQTTAEV